MTQVCQILKLQRGGNQSVRRGKDKRKPEICDLYLTFSLAAISTTLYLHVYKEYISKEEEDDGDDDDDDDFKDRIINVQVRSEVSRATNCCLSARTQSGKTPPP